jgi:hypothetical protein
VQVELRVDQIVARLFLLRSKEVLVPPVGCSAARENSPRPALALLRFVRLGDDRRRMHPESPLPSGGYLGPAIKFQQILSVEHYSFHHHNGPAPSPPPPS